MLTGSWISAWMHKLVSCYTLQHLPTIVYRLDIRLHMHALKWAEQSPVYSTTYYWSPRENFRKSIERANERNGRRFGCVGHTSPEKLNELSLLCRSAISFLWMAKTSLTLVRKECQANHCDNVLKSWPLAEIEDQIQQYTVINTIPPRESGRTLNYTQFMRLIGSSKPSSPIGIRR